MEFKEFLETVLEENIVETIFNKNVELGDLKVEQLENRQKLEKMTISIRDKKSDLMNNTDWKSLEITNSDGRNAYLNKETIKDQNAIDDLNHTIRKQDLIISRLRRELRLCDHIISKYDSLGLEPLVQSEDESSNNFTTADNYSKDTGMGDPKASQYIQQAKEYLLGKKEPVTIEKIKNLALEGLNDPESVMNKDSFNKVIKQLKIEGV